MFNGVGVRFAVFIFRKYPMKMKQFPNYFIFMGYFKTGGGGGGREGGSSEPSEPTMDPPLGFETTKG